MEDKELREQFDHTRFVIRQRTIPWWVYYVIGAFAFFGMLKACGG